VTVAYERLHGNLKALKLHTVESVVDGYLESTSAKGKSVLEVLDYLFDQESKARNVTLAESRARLARFPARKTIEDFDFEFQPSVDKAVVRELATLRFIHNAENVLLVGPPGTGKTHLAIALGVEAAKSGLSVYFSTVFDAMNRLKKAEVRGTFDIAMRSLVQPKLLILDEIGYLPMDRESAHLFFRVVSDRYEKGSMVLTSNKTFSEWGEVMGDPVMASAVLDRVLHHGTVIHVKGESYRLRERRRLGAQRPGASLPVERKKGTKEANE
jgi:DNA replication protein DnaC